MPRKRLKRKKPLPKILKTPFRYKVDFLYNSIGMSTPAAEEEGRRFARELAEKINALAEYYGVRLVEIDPKSDLFRLVIAMACERFPGFQFEPEGTPTTRQPKWTPLLRIELLEIMRERIRHGMTLEKAAIVYRDVHKARYGSTLDVRGIVTRFKEAEAWEKNIELTAYEILQIFRRMHEGSVPEKVAALLNRES
jgi:hypothetical protein